MKSHLFPPPPSHTDAIFLQWYNKRQCPLQLCTEFGLPATHLSPTVRYDCAISLFPNYPSTPPKQPWENLLEPNSKQRSLTEIYGQLSSLDECSLTKTRVVWEQELGIKFTEKGWKRSKGPMQALSVLDLQSYSPAQDSPFYSPVVRNVSRRRGQMWQMSNAYAI